MEVGSLEAGSCEIGCGEVGIFEMGFVEVGSFEMGCAEVGFFEMGSAEVGTFEMAFAEVGFFEIGFVEVGSVKVGNLPWILLSPLIPILDPLRPAAEQVECFVSGHGGIIIAAASRAKGCGCTPAGLVT